MNYSGLRPRRSGRLAWWVGKRVAALTAGAVLVITSFMWIYFQVRDYLLLRSLPVDAAMQLRALRLNPQEHQAALWDFARAHMSVDHIMPGMSAEDWLTVFLLVTASMPIVAVTALWASRPLARQFAAIIRAAKRVAAGDFSASATVVDTAPSEVVELATTFNSMTARLSQYQREVTDSSAVLAHELRTPLNAALGRLDGLVDGVFPRSDEQLKIISNQRHQMNRLVNDLHTLSMARSGSMHLEREVFDVAELLTERTSWFMHPANSQEIRIIVHTSTASMVCADRDRIGQVLAVLMDNAVRHGGAGGEIRVGATEVGDKVVVSVQDTGPGVAPGEIRHLADRFWRSDASRSRHSGGSGLGLSIAAAICEAHGGELAFANGAQGGLICTLTLPRL